MPGLGPWTLDSSIRLSISPILEAFVGGCDFAQTYITVGSEGVEGTAGAGNLLMEIAFLRHCLNVTTYCVRREIKVKLNYFLLSHGSPANFRL